MNILKPHCIIIKVFLRNILLNHILLHLLFGVAYSKLFKNSKSCSWIDATTRSHAAWTATARWARRTWPKGGRAAATTASIVSSSSSAERTARSESVAATRSFRPLKTLPPKCSRQTTRDSASGLLTTFHRRMIQHFLYITQIPSPLYLCD